ncbi:N-isopropylammelide isopropyl amidohydrolase [Sporomusa rhizae]|uniref:amidohydrolase family protein n=1 Tax=Sporomusa rhizae TaxID=357999 RepID=UPI00352A2C38
MKYFFKNANLVLEQKTVDLAVCDGKIDFVSNVEEGNFDKVVDLKGKMVLKGFCDLHTHLDKALISTRVANRSGTLAEAIAIMSEYKAKMTDEDIYERAESTLLMCYKNGTRFLRTHIDVDKNIGIRSILVMKELQKKYRHLMQIQIVAFPQEGIVDKPQNYQALDQALAAGADLVGGIPVNDLDPQKHIDMVFKLALKYNVDIDMHIDETDRADCMTLLQLAYTTISMGWQGRVTAGHCCSLAANPPEIVDSILEKVHMAGIKIVSLPSTNLYLQGRGDTCNIRRGIAPIKRIYQEHCIPTALASDNIRDPFNPFGNGNLLETALIAAHGCHMGGNDDIDLLFDMITRQPIEMFGADYHIYEGEEADFIIIDAATPGEAIIAQKRLYGYFRNNTLNF